MDFKELITIDKYNLDEEWLNQPLHTYNFAEKLADAQKRMDKAKEKVEIVKAELTLDIAKNPSNYGLTKTTQALIDAVIIKEQSYLDAQEELRELKFEVGVLQSAVKAFDQRKTALENLVKLHNQSYYAEPTVQSSEQAENLKDIKKNATKERIKARRRKRSEI